MTAVSVLLPCRNVAPTLPEALRSLWAQSFDDFEVIAVDDGSTDESAEILRSHARSEPRLRVVHQRHGGIVSALTHGASLARAPLIARMDADDRIHRDRFRRQVSHLRQRAELSVSSSRVRLFPRQALGDGYLRYESWVNSVTTHDAIRENLFVESPIPHPSVMIRRSALDAVGGYRDVGWPEDYDLWMRLAFAGHRFEKLEDVLLDWRDSPRRSSRVEPAYAAERFSDLKEHYLREHVLDRSRALAIWGAGPIGKDWARRLRPRFLIELDPKKVGQRIHGAEVIGSAELMRLEGAFIVVAVGALSRRRSSESPWLSARDEIREALDEASYVELSDFICVA